METRKAPSLERGSPLPALTATSDVSIHDLGIAAGDEALAKEILDRRTVLVRRIGALELAVFAEQTNDKKKRLSPDELQRARTDVIDALDPVIAKMGCQLKDDGSERRWRSGACEILPLNPNLRDLAY